MKVTFLGTGTSQGIPVISCPCAICHSPDTRDQRLRTSILIDSGDTCIAVDAGPDFRQQMLREKVKRLDAVLFTHAHKDHLAGLDDVRAFNYFQQQPMDVYATLPVQQVIRNEFSYAFDRENDYPGIPKIKLHMIDLRPFKIRNIAFDPIEVFHFKLPVLGFRFNDFTYITEANFISEEEKRKIKGSRFLVLNALRKEKHISHFNLEEAIALAKEIGAEATYFTHISHQLGKHEEVEKLLPPNIYLAYDGLKIEW
ncbi:MAG: MBL fold metallo-hydrolase [Chitinophagaceae bacterium]|nr:MBL fold metallo-hydrolase [Chitinophagaceae bacterium]